MASVVLDLQQDALDRRVPVTDLLRKALVVAHKLSLRELEQWVTREMNGYGKDDQVPEYRQIHGQVKAWNPYRGWQPVMFEEPETGEKLSVRPCGQSIAELESLVEGRDRSPTLHIPFPIALERHMSKAVSFDTQFALEIPGTAVVRILDAVRTVVLNWSMRLEEDGILGEGLSFTRKERETAEAKTYNISNFYGPVQSPQIQQGAERAVQVSVPLNVDVGTIKEFMSSLRAVWKELGLKQDAEAELKAEVESIEAQIASPKPKDGVVKECLGSIRRILEGAAGGAGGHLLVELAKLLS